MPPKFKDIQKRIEEDGWQQVRQTGSHRHFKHPTKPGIVTIAGKDSATPHDGTYLNILRQAGLRMRDYAIIYEQGPEGWSAYAPDLPGLGAAAESFEEVDQLIRDGIEAHIEVLRETGNPVPEPTTRVAVMSTAA